MTTRLLLAGAVTFTLADIAAFAVLILPGHAVEANPLVAGLSPAAAMSARGILLVALGSLAVVAHLLTSRALRLTVAGALLIAIAIGALGAGTTVLAAIS